MPRTAQVKTEKRTQPVRSTRQFLETEEQQVGQDRPRNLKAKGKAREALEPTVVQPVERVVANEKLEALKFMEDVLTVMVHDSTNPTDHPMPSVWNDGRQQFFPRGKEVQAKRKFVEVLARMKNTTYSQEPIPNMGGYRNIPHTALKYPFSVLHDPSPRGGAWLKNLLAEG